MNLQDSHDWLMWQAREAVGEPHFKAPIVLVPPQAPKQRKKRKKHWAGSFQIRFCHWLKGDGERPCNLGYTRRDLIRHLERQFSKGMTWENYASSNGQSGRKVWVVDHIVPKRLYAEDDVQHAYALTNMRPLWMNENMRKGPVREHLL